MGRQSIVGTLSRDFNIIAWKLFVVVTSASNPGGHGRTTNEVRLRMKYSHHQKCMYQNIITVIAQAKYWKDKYINAEKILKKKVEKARILEEKVHNLAKRNNKAFSSIEYVVETQKRANESEFRDIQSNDHPHIDAITQQSDLTREAKRPIRISSAVSSSTASSSHHPASSHEGSDLSASSSSSLLTTNSDDSTQQQDHGDLSNSGNFSDTLSVTQAYYKPFQIQMSDRSDRDSDGAQAVELIPATVNDSDNNDNDNDDTASVRTITKSPSQHSLTFCHLRPSHRDNPESHMHVVEPEGLREFREVHHKITKKYRRTK